MLTRLTARDALARGRAVRVRYLRRRGGPVSRGDRRWLPWATAAFVLAGLFYRAPDVFDHPQLWAEDGSVFFQDAWTQGLRSIVLPYAGYLHLAPRLVALSAEPFGAVAAPSLYATAAVLLTLWAAGTIAAAKLPCAPLLGALVILVPGCGDVLGTITNAQWILQAALLAVVVSEAPDGTAARANQSALCVVSGLSGPFSILISPLAAWCVLRGRRDPHGWTVGALVACSALVQVGFVMASADNVAPGPTRPMHLFHAMLRLSLGPAGAGWPLQAAAIAVMALALVHERRFAPAVLSYATIAFAATWVRYLANGEYMDHGWGERYFYMPRLFILWCIAVCLFGPWRRPEGGAPPWIAGLSCAVGLAALAIVAADARPWRRTPLDVMPWRSQAWRIDRGEAAVIPINPSNQATPLEKAWRVDVPAMP